MHHGRVLADDRPAAIPELLPGSVVEVRVGSRQAGQAALAGVEALADLTVFGATLHARLVTDQARAIETVEGALAAAGIAGADVVAIRPTLEDAFLYLTRTEAS
jgi:hypothetical protein